MFFILPTGNLGIEKLNNLPNRIALYSQHDLITVNIYLFQNSTFSPKLFLPLYGVFLPLLMSKIICQLWEEDCYHYWLCGCIDVSPCGHPDEKPEATITNSQSVLSAQAVEEIVQKEQVSIDVDILSHFSFSQYFGSSQA